MATVVQCPNPSCGRTSHLGEDPLGRIFRCPRCLTKLPTAGAAGSDSGWTAVLGPLPRRSSSSRLDSSPAGRMTPVFAPARSSVGFESGEFFAGAFESDGDDSWESRFSPGGLVAQQESGEMLAGPFGVDEEDGHRRPFSRSDHGGLGRFRIAGVLGEGRHSTVYRAFDPVLERDVALKLPRRGGPRTARALARILSEARALARLRHPRIVPVYEAGRDGDSYYIAMALIEGRGLAQLLAEGALPFVRGAEIVAEMAEALAHAHSLGIVHRDVKPANIRLDPRGAVYLMDFGIAYRPDSGEVPAPPGTILGTPAYVAPEQARGGQSDILPASDQYSLGAVLYEILCGRPPFSGPPSYVLFHTIHRDPPSPRAVDPRIPRPLASICLKALAKRPEQRYSSCQALADDLRRWLRGESPLAHRRGWARLTL